MKLENKNKVIDTIVALIPFGLLFANIKFGQTYQNKELINTFVYISAVISFAALTVGIWQYSKLKDKNRGNSLTAFGTVLNFIVGIYLLLFFTYL